MICVILRVNKAQKGSIARCAHKTPLESYRVQRVPEATALQYELVPPYCKFVWMVDEVGHPQRQIREHKD